MRYFLSILIGFLLTVIGAEAVLRFLPVSTGLAYQPSSEDSPVVRGKPYFQYTFSSGWNFRMRQHGTLNNFGFPSPTDYDPAQSSIVIVGDSYIESTMLAPDDRLQTQLAMQLHAPVYALGRSGSHLAQKLGVAKWAMQSFNPRALVVNLTDTDVSSALSSAPGDFHFVLEETGCLLSRDDRPEDGATRNFVKGMALYRYLFSNLKLSVTLRRHLVGRSEKRDLSAMSPRSQDEQITECFLRLLPQVVSLPADRVVFLVGADLVSIYFREPSRPSDTDLLADALTKKGYAVIRTDELFRADYAQHRLPLSFRPTDDHWNARAHRIVAAQLAIYLRAHAPNGPVK